MERGAPSAPGPPAGAGPRPLRQRARAHVQQRSNTAARVREATHAQPSLGVSMRVRVSDNMLLYMYGTCTGDTIR